MANRWRLPIKPKFVSTRLLPGRRLRLNGSGVKVFVPWSVPTGAKIMLGPYPLTVHSGGVSGEVPNAWFP